VRNGHIGWYGNATGGGRVIDGVLAEVSGATAPLVGAVVGVGGIVVGAVVIGRATVVGPADGVAGDWMPRPDGLTTTLFVDIPCTTATVASPTMIAAASARDANARRRVTARRRAAAAAVSMSAQRSGESETSATCSWIAARSCSSMFVLIRPPSDVRRGPPDRGAHASSPILVRCRAFARSPLPS